MTRLAAMPFENGGVNCRTRLFAASTTQRLPAGSNANKVGRKQEAEMPLQSCAGVNELWPISRLAAIPVENGGTNSRMRPSLISVTHKFPSASKAAALGSQKSLAV